MRKERFHRVANIEKRKHFSIVDSTKELPVAKSYCAV